MRGDGAEIKEWNICGYAIVHSIRQQAWSGWGKGVGACSERDEDIAES